MWSWIKEKIDKKLNKWHNRSLSLTGRIQVCQKMLSSYSIYYSSAWMLSNYQILEIQKAIRSFLWSDVKGNRKRHAVKWDWCHTDKLLGGLGLKDLKTQGIALSAKWIFHYMDGNDPWKVLVRHNIVRGFPKKARSWRNLPFCDLIVGNFLVNVQGSAIFRSIWRAWDHVRNFITNKDFHDAKHLYGERSIWWNLHQAGKPLALSKGCSARLWAKLGISQLADLFENDKLINWDELKNRFNTPDSQKKTYNMIVKATKDLPSNCHVDSHRYLKCKWPDGVIMVNLKAKNIYRIIDHNENIINHINTVWYSSLDAVSWKKYFDILWKGPVEPKIRCFRWLILLDRLPIRQDGHTTDICSLCRLPETGRHILFDCIFAKEIWNMFGIFYTLNVNILEIVTGHIDGLKKDANLFWNMLSSNILWQIWKCRNEERYQSNLRVLTEFFQKLTFLKIFLQVHTTMMMEKDKLRRFLKDGHAIVFVYELKHGHEWRRNFDDLQMFERTCKRPNQEIRKNINSRENEIFMLTQIRECKIIVWMEGPLGWTAWVDTHYDVLH
ncbi:uncharacterized protein LOC131079670 [Cryptomeria japonica]|uniref:uncharacterized protein LOC131079670 n=1 Tax=Cryptomeria japonica TaxID=3369 RepID=UPI0027DA21F6|nr:uncharacterized protein LOC131079670 [Cryptomeria japonica]